jgi:RNA polymerase sigma-70 factor (ECF subfamily)
MLDDGVSMEDDYLLMEAISRRDAAALSRLYDRHATLVYTLCLRILKDPALAEDAMIDVFTELWQRADRYNPARAAPIAYLLTLTRSRALDRARSKSAHPTIPLHETPDTQQSPAINPLQSALEDERRSLIQHALTQLDPKYRDVLECAYFEGLSHSEIALKLQKPIGTVKTYLRRGLIQLRDLLRNQDEGAGAP